MKLVSSRVPNEYRCTTCSHRISTMNGQGPSCPTCGPGSPMGAVGWQEVAEERERALDKVKSDYIVKDLEVGQWKVRTWFFAIFAFIEAIWILFRGMP